MKFNVVIHLEGALDYEIEANNAEEAVACADESEICEAISEFNVCDVYEI